MTQGSVTVHEVVEQGAKQLEGKAYPQAHAEGKAVESGVNEGWERGAERRPSNQNETGSDITYTRKTTTTATDEHGNEVTTTKTETKTVKARKNLRTGELTITETPATVTETTATTQKPKKDGK